MDGHMTLKQNRTGLYKIEIDKIKKYTILNIRKCSQYILFNSSLNFGITSARFTSL